MIDTAHPTRTKPRTKRRTDSAVKRDESRRWHVFDHEGVLLDTFDEYDKAVEEAALDCFTYQAAMPYVWVVDTHSPENGRYPAQAVRVITMTQSPGCQDRMEIIEAVPEFNFITPPPPPPLELPDQDEDEGDPDDDEDEESAGDLVPAASTAERHTVEIDLGQELSDPLSRDLFAFDERDTRLEVYGKVESHRIRYLMCRAFNVSTPRPGEADDERLAQFLASRAAFMNVGAVVIRGCGRITVETMHLVIELLGALRHAGIRVRIVDDADAGPVALGGVSSDAAA